MTGPEHIRQAERMLNGGDVNPSEALIHAILALVEATREIGDQLDTMQRHGVRHADT